jgi:spore maturation protein CgeB
MDYRDSRDLFMDQCVGVADFYSKNLKKLGYEAEEIICNDEFLQRKWLSEFSANSAYKYASQEFLFRCLKRFGQSLQCNLGRLGENIYSKFRSPVKSAAFGSSKWEPWKLEILAQQIKRFKPDILYNQAIHYVDGEFLREIKPSVKWIVGQHASPIPHDFPRHTYDLMLSSLPNLVEQFREMGLRTEYLKLGFESTLLDQVKTLQALYRASFVGGFSSLHQKGIQILEKVAGEFPVDFWGYGAETLPRNSAILKSYHGEAWGIKMYEIFSQSKIVLNRHLNLASQYANNMRLYEATGMGALLLTDHKDNLNDIFEIGKEVVSYRNEQECLELLQYYAEHEVERAAIARAGQQRVLKEHTYFHRMQELLSILKKYL